LNTFAAALSPSCFDLAVTGWDFVEVSDSFAPYWNTRLNTFLQKMSIRKSLIEGIL